jgi:alkylation response protein AidB-like acyl-CoA dehydrogenase/putative sterol carrier protein
MHSIYFTQEHEAFRRSVRRFVTEEVAPHAEAWEQEGRIPRGIFRRMGELGFLGILHPEAHGGQEGDLFFAIAFLEELPRSLMGGFCASVSVQQFMATAHIAANGSEDLKRRYLAPSIAGAKVGALAITEPDTGSDVASIRTRARRDGDHFVVNGAKTFITNGADGDFFTLAVRTGSAEDGAAGISLLAVDADAPGVRVARRLRKLGWHSSDTAELSFEEVRVPAGHLIGEENSGFYQIMEAFALERLCGAAISIGSSVVALDFTRRYMAQRKAFGRPLDRFQVLRHRMADLYAELEASRQLTYHAAWLRREGRPAVLESSMAKLMATELGKKVADECLQFFGGYGFMEEYPAARFYRDARAATIAAGTSEIMREIIIRLALDQGSPQEEGAAPAARAPRQTAHPEPLRPAGAGQQAPAPPEPSPCAPPAGDAPAPPEPPRTVEALMRSLPARLRPGKTDGWRSLFHYSIQGAASPEWTVRIDGESVSVSEGLDGEPDCRVEMKEATYLGIETGTLNPQSAFMMGKVKVSNLAEMMRFIQAFRPVRSR